MINQAKVFKEERVQNERKKMVKEVEIEELKVEELNALPFEKRLLVTNKYQGRPAQYKCTSCGKEKFANNVFIIFGKEWIVKDLLCYKCHQSQLTLKKLGPIAYKRMQKK